MNSTSGFEFGVVFLLEWLPIKVEELSLLFYFTCNLLSPYLLITTILVKSNSALLSKQHCQPLLHCPLAMGSDSLQTCFAMPACHTIQNGKRVYWVYCLKEYSCPLDNTQTDSEPVCSCILLRQHVGLGILTTTIVSSTWCTRTWSLMDCCLISGNKSTDHTLWQIKFLGNSSLFSF